MCIRDRVQEHITPEKMTVLVVEPMKKPYVKEIDPGLHSLQAEVGLSLIHIRCV